MKNVLYDECWLEFHRHPGVKTELFLALDHVRDPFWAALSAQDGACIGWVRFERFCNIKGQVLYSASELRPADAPAPPESDVWPHFVTMRGAK